MAIDRPGKAAARRKIHDLRSAAKCQITPGPIFASVVCSCCVGLPGALVLRGEVRRLRNPVLVLISRQVQDWTDRWNRRKEENRATQLRGALSAERVCSICCQ